MDSIFHDGVDITHLRRVSTDAKVLISIKYLAYECSTDAFWDYFQFDESTTMLCMKKFTASVLTLCFKRSILHL
jgi:hypothetical protein